MRQHQDQNETKINTAVPVQQEKMNRKASSGEGQFQAGPNKKALESEQKTKKLKKDHRQIAMKRMAVWTVILVTVAAILLNWLFGTLLGDHLKFDWTSNQIQTISEESQKLLDEMETPVQLIALAKPGEFIRNAQLAFVEDLMRDYEKKSKGKISLRYVDPEVNPEIVKEIDPQNLSQVTRGALAVYGPETKKLRLLNPLSFLQRQMNPQTYEQSLVYAGESLMSTAIKYASSKESYTVYFARNHQEDDLTQNYQIMSQFLMGSNFEVKDLQGVEITQMPSDADLLVFLNPKTDLLENEVAVLQNYIKEGGNILLALNFTDLEVPRFNEVLKEANIQLDQQRIREEDTRFSLQNDPHMFTAFLKPSPVVQEQVKIPTLVSQVRAVSLAGNDKDWIKTSSILSTSIKGRLEQGGRSDQLSSSGEQSIGLFSEIKGYVGGTNQQGETIENSSKVLVLGDAMIWSDGLMSAYFSSAYNYQLMAKSFYALTNRAEETNVVRPVTAVSYNLPVEVYPSINYVVSFVFFILPLFFVLWAIVVYRRRRNL